MAALLRSWARRALRLARDMRRRLPRLRRERGRDVVRARRGCRSRLARVVRRTPRRNLEGDAVVGSPRGGHGRRGRRRRRRHGSRRFVPVARSSPRLSSRSLASVVRVGGHRLPRPRAPGFLPLVSDRPADVPDRNPLIPRRLPPVRPPSQVTLARRRSLRSPPPRPTTLSPSPSWIRPTSSSASPPRRAAARAAPPPPRTIAPEVPTPRHPPRHPPRRPPRTSPNPCDAAGSRGAAPARSPRGEFRRPRRVHRVAIPRAVRRTRLRRLHPNR